MLDVEDKRLKENTAGSVLLSKSPANGASAVIDSDVNSGLTIELGR